MRDLKYNVMIAAAVIILLLSIPNIAVALDFIIYGYVSFGLGMMILPCFCIFTIYWANKKKSSNKTKR